MNWIDRLISIVSMIILIATSTDAILHGLNWARLVLGLCLLIAMGAFLYLYYRPKQEEPDSPLLGPRGEPLSKPTYRAGLTFQLSRALVLIGCAGVFATFLVLRSKPSLDVHIDEVASFEVIKGNTKIVYSIAGEYEAIPVYGRGQKVLLSLKNRSDLPLHVVAVRVLVLNRLSQYPEHLRYKKHQESVPHARLPIEHVRGPIRLKEVHKTDTVKLVGVGRIRLEKSGSDKDTHQMLFAVEAGAVGLWKYCVEVEYEEPRRGNSPRILRSEPLMILRHGS